MTKVDWSKAPEGATHYKMFGLNRWVKQEGGGVYVYSEGNWVPMLVGMVNMDDLIARPCNCDGCTDGDDSGLEDLAARVPMHNAELSNAAVNFCEQVGAKWDHSKREWVQSDESADTSEWRGPEDGLPPVGSVVEYKGPRDGAWKECEVLAHRRGKAVCWNDETQQSGLVPVETMRRIRTEEDKAVESIADAINDGEHTSSVEQAMKIARTLYRANLRLQD